MNVKRYVQDYEGDLTWNKPVRRRRRQDACTRRLIGYQVLGFGSQSLKVIFSVYNASLARVVFSRERVNGGFDNHPLWSITRSPCQRYRSPARALAVRALMKREGLVSSMIASFQTFFVVVSWKDFIYTVLKKDFTRKVEAKRRKRIKISLYAGKVY
jgi:hypothetical protein